MSTRQVLSILLTSTILFFVVLHLKNREPNAVQVEEEATVPVVGFVQF